MTNVKTYSELKRLPTFEERYEYLRIHGKVGEATFGDERIFNQMFYTSYEWRKFRHQIIARDLGNDLGIEDRPIVGSIYVHHINPLTLDELKHGGEELFDPENFICCSYNTHQAIHFGDMSLLIPSKPLERKPNDTCPWKQ
jgi:hypothetical protein